MTLPECCRPFVPTTASLAYKPSIHSPKRAMIFFSSSGVGPGPVPGWRRSIRYWLGELIVPGGYNNTTNDRVDSGQKTRLLFAPPALALAGASAHLPPRMSDL